MANAAFAGPRGDAKSAVSVVRTVDPADRSYDDLEAFGKAIGSARCVVLGEQTHGDGNVFSLKVRLVEYLHDKMGFDVLAMESGIYDGAKVEQAVAGGKAMRDEVGGSIFYMYSGTKQVAPLWDYIDAQRSTARPLSFVTIDSQLSGKKSQDSLCVDLEAQLRARGSSIPDSAEWSTFKVLTLGVFQMHQTKPSDEDQKAYLATLDAIDAVFAADREQAAPRPTIMGE
jgi:erythromycin esterase